ncbi:hypothetical protein [Janibacter sp. YB324]|uniref:hypothetical protein n=1 Tax=Janibacter sp. YB324 TaxID=2761047 RepID=UPI001624C274|nr:hypothetical protein [Janibacter sp. YB324]QNF94949.1 hypothetical protein H7A72_03920 [Janibacter sp. YB324]
MVNRENIYFRSPAIVQDLLSSAAGAGVDRTRYSGTYEEAEWEYKQRGGWSASALSAFALSRRAQTLALASETPYYRDVFAGLGAEWFELVDDAAFAQIPATPKSDLRENPEGFSPRPVASSDATTRTSGTTGSSVEILRSRSAVDEQWAVWWRYRGWHGISRDEPCALFAGRRIMRADQGAPYWRHNVPGRELRFSTYHISSDSAPAYVDRLNRFAPRWIHGFSSAISNLATCVIDQGLEVAAPIKWVSLGGENVTTLQMETIREAFGVQPIQHYGLAEGAANFSTCTEGRLHVDEDFAGVEFVPEGDGVTRVLGTTFANRARILLRYDTGDLATLSESMQCGCGFGGRIVASLDGRGDETITLPDGRLVGSPEDAFRTDMGVSQAQLLQRRDGSIVVSYVPSAAWAPDSLARVETALRNFLGHEISISFREVEDLPRTAGGKVRLVVKEPLPA